MKEAKTRHIIIPALILVTLLIAFVLFLKLDFFHSSNLNFHSSNSNKSDAPKLDYPTIINNSDSFPSKNPQFTATLGHDKNGSGKHESIIIYPINDKTKPVFQSNFYSDAFHGDELSYSFSADTTTFTQKGSLSTIPCSSGVCQLEWNNFYRWDAKQNTFVLDNLSHKNFFQQLKGKYQTIDNQGCNFAGNETLPEQKGLTLAQLYKKYPSRTSYCSKSQAITNSQLLFFLKAEKVINQLVNGINLGSSDIKIMTL
jgi:hypothetical protein